MKYPSLFKIDNKLLYEAKIHALVKQSYPGIFSSVVLACILVLLLKDVASPEALIIWISALITINVARLLNTLIYKHTPEKALKSTGWLIMFYAGFLFSGILWGTSVLLLPPHDNLIYVSITALCVCGIVSGASASYALSKRVCFGFAYLSLIPSIIYFLSYDDNIYRSIALGILTYFIFITFNTFSLNKIFTESLKREINERGQNFLIKKQKDILHIIADSSERLLEGSWEIAIPDLLRKLGKMVNVSRVHVFENVTDENSDSIKTQSKFVWEYSSTQVFKYNNPPVTYEQLGIKNWANKLGRGEPVFGKIHSFDYEEQEFIKSLNINSFFVVPIFVDNQWWGGISFDECRYERDWKIEEIDALKTAAAVIGAAIKRTWAEDKLSYEASHDSLTGLHNRRAFELYLKNIVKKCGENDETHVLCYIDLDRFKVINDTCGHHAGDNLLRQISNVMKQSVRSVDYIARIGGDEFAILLNSISMDEAKYVADNIQKNIEKYSFHWDDKVFRVGASIGLVVINSISTSIDKILQTADYACRSVKKSNNQQLRILNVDDTEMNHQLSDTQSYIKINNALDTNEFTLLFQPISSIKNLDSTWSHFEALIRMYDENASLITPKRFLPTAERYNLISKIDKWVFEKCLKILSENRSLFENIKTLSINLSGATLCESKYLKFVTSLLEKYNIPASKICFEITETVAVSNLVDANNFIKYLRGLGCKFALDDFGTGFSSFENLKHIPVDYIKIDGMFIKDIHTNPIDYEMVRSLHKISELMNIETIAEYVDSKKILETLDELGVNYVQGYAISEPIHLDSVINSYRASNIKKLKFAS